MKVTEKKEEKCHKASGRNIPLAISISQLYTFPGKSESERQRKAKVTEIGKELKAGNAGVWQEYIIGDINLTTFTFSGKSKSERKRKVKVNEREK